MAENVHGIDLSSIPKKSDGTRIWPADVREKIVGLMGKVPTTQLASDLELNATQLYQWRSRANGGPKKKKKTSSMVAAVLPDTAGIIEALRTKREKLLESAAQIGRTISVLENGGIAPETVKLSDAMEPAKPKRRMSAEGRERISKAAKKRWREYHSRNAKAKKAVRRS